MDRLDVHDRMPDGMKAYLANYGWHFSKKMCDWATSKMKSKPVGATSPGKITALKKEEVDALLAKHNITLENDAGYDSVFVANMAKADYPNAVGTERIAMFVKEYIDDPDGYDGLPFTRFYADCIGSGRPIIWEDMM